MLNMSQTIERTTLTQLVTNEQYARKVLPFMKKDYFSDRTERTVFEEITFICSITNFVSELPEPNGLNLLICS